MNLNKINDFRRNLCYLNYWVLESSPTSMAILQIFARKGRSLNGWKQFCRFSTIERANIKFIAQRSDNDGQQEKSDWHLLILSRNYLNFKMRFKYFRICLEYSNKLWTAGREKPFVWNSTFRFLSYQTHSNLTRMSNELLSIRDENRPNNTCLEFSAFYQ